MDIESKNTIHEWLEKFGQIHSIAVKPEIERIWFDLFESYSPSLLEDGFREVIGKIETFPVPAHLMNSQPLRSENFSRTFDRAVAQLRCRPRASARSAESNKLNRQ